MENALAAIQQKIHPQTVNDAVKDDYFFEFLNIPQQRVSLLKEKELETSLLDHLRDFIIELRKRLVSKPDKKESLSVTNFISLIWSSTTGF